MRAVPQCVAALIHFAASYEAPMNRGGPLVELRHQDAAAVDGPRRQRTPTRLLSASQGVRVRDRSGGPSDHGLAQPDDQVASGRSARLSRRTTSSAGSAASAVRTYITEEASERLRGVPECLPQAAAAERPTYGRAHVRTCQCLIPPKARETNSGKRSCPLNCPPAVPGAPLTSGRTLA